MIPCTHPHHHQENELIGFSSKHCMQAVHQEVEKLIMITEQLNIIAAGLERQRKAMDG